MPSSIDPANPAEGTPTTQSVRDNFQFAKDEIEALQLAMPTPLQFRGLADFQRTVSEVNGEMQTPQTILQAATATAALSANVARLIPFRVPRDGTIDRVQFNVTVLGAGNCNIALYDGADYAPFLPGNLLAESGDISIAGTGIKTLTAGLSVSEGQLLYAALLCSISATWTTIAAANCIPFFTSAAGTFGTGRNLVTTPQAYGAYPADLSGNAFTLAAAAAPLLGISM